MPEMDGFTVCDQLRRDPGTKDLPIIFLSSLQDAKDRTRGIELGAVDFIIKPSTSIIGCSNTLASSTPPMSALACTRPEKARSC
jgi:PleD family two-component response regulator